MHRVALVLVLIASFVHAQPTGRGQAPTTTPAGDLLITITFKSSMTGNVPSQLPDAAREQESITVIKVKGTKVAISGRPLHPTVPIDITTVSDTASGDIVTIDHTRKVYMRATAEQQEQMLAIGRKMMETQNGPLPKERPIAKPTGKTAEISGYAVDEYVADTPKVRYTYWVAPSLRKYVTIGATTLVAASGPMGAAAMMWQPDPAKLPGVPMRTTLEYRRDGYTQVATTTIQSFREVTLEADDFAIPTGYQEFAPGRHGPK